jgi:type VII secretion effector (TIGR04197 family)
MRVKTMAEVKIDKSTYDAVVEQIENLSARSGGNNAGFSVTKATTVTSRGEQYTQTTFEVSKSKGTIFLDYVKTIEDLKTLLSEYNTVLSTDVNKLYSLGADLKELDTALSQGKSTILKH